MLHKRDSVYKYDIEAENSQSCHTEQVIFLNSPHVKLLQTFKDSLLAIHELVCGLLLYFK